MGHIDITKTIQIVLTATEAADRANQVRKDPAVVVAAKEFMRDVHESTHSAARLVKASREAWRRTDRPRGGTSAAWA
ncbi:hypothetical protein Q6350_03590 [Isoptericola sp. b515]|uniref:hypothetical protein n=1 Tax=Isoptericola sp. b515 TaxID=3064652 RepID=UPI0027137A70|nr:hypothetical protein [Isoptericola sp. b515]MDO8147506.1 hypothetical protein [Isoptericola sp. b515]